MALKINSSTLNGAQKQFQSPCRFSDVTVAPKTHFKDPDILLTELRQSVLPVADWYPWLHDN